MTVVCRWRRASTAGGERRSPALLNESVLESKGPRSFDLRRKRDLYSVDSGQAVGRGGEGEGKGSEGGEERGGAKSPPLLKRRRLSPGRIRDLIIDVGGDKRI